MTLRRQKNPSPGFRLPKPHDPVAGGHGPMILDALLCRFVLTQALTTAMEKATATIEEQWGYGGAHSYHDRIWVHNYLTSVADTYRFQGEEGAMGLAYWDSCQDWVILDIQDPVPGAPSTCLIGGCLAENHPGRGIVFDIKLGTWNNTTHRWDYGTDLDKAIDWRYDVPYPDEGATGLFEARSSAVYGIIYETVALDCTTPGPCGS